MNILNDFFLKSANLKLQKRLGEDRIMDSLSMPLFDVFFQIRTLKKTRILYESLKRFLFSNKQI